MSLYDHEIATTLFWKSFKDGKKMNDIGGFLFIASDQPDAFKKLVKRFSVAFPDMPATVPVHHKFLEYDMDRGWSMWDGDFASSRAFPVLVVDPYWRPSHVSE